MSRTDDIIDAGLNLGAMTLSHYVRKEAEKSLAQAYERNDLLGILISAGAYGASSYAYQSSARNLARLIGKYQRTLPAYDFRVNKPRKTPTWYLPNKNRKSTKARRS
jgi:hypothetical protein